jgi:SAM-dependent methyltransferase
MSAVAFLNGYDVVICKQCGLGFADDIPEQGVFDRYYQGNSKYEYQHTGGKESESDESRFRAIAETLARSVAAKSSRVLEIGCATGRLLALLRDAGFANVQGLDPSPGCAQAAWDLYKVPVFAGSLFSIPASSNAYDLVISVGVLEHVEDTSKALDCIRAVLSPEGLVYAEVPDGSRYAGRPDAPYQEFSIEHINFFSTVSLSNLFRRNSFCPISTGEAIRQQNENTTCPAAFGIFQSAETRLPLERDDVTEPGLRRYIEESAAVDARVRRVIRDSARGRELLVWGAATHTQRLLAAGAFANIRISAFVDSNPKLHGHTLQGIPILSPASLSGRSEPILISTRGFQREIRDQIRHRLNLDNEVILLYEDN